MHRRNWVILAIVAGAVTQPGALHAQEECSGGNNMFTRSASLYLDRARSNPRAEEKAELHRQAIEVSLEGTKTEPGNPRVWFLAGQAFARTRDLARADSMWDRVEEICAGKDFENLRTERQNAWVGAYNAGVTANQQGRADEAIEAMKMADLIYQGRPEARLNLGAFYANKGQHAEAIEAFRGALEILRGPASQNLDEKQKAAWAENEEVAVFNLAQLLALAGRDDEAVEAYRNFLARDPENLTAKQNLAVVLSRQGKRDEAAQIYAELLQRDDLDDRDYFNLGVGLFTAEQHERATQAFLKSLELNPHSRDALMNLAQSAYVPSLKLEEQRANATGAAARELDGRLKGMYEQIIEGASKALDYDPNNPNLYLLVARANRGLADMVTGATSDNFRRQALSALEKQKALAFEVEDVAVMASENETTIRGRIENVSAAAGTPIRLTFTILARDGSVLGTQEVTVTAPAAQESVPFELTAAVKGADVGGWKYVIG